MKHLSVEFVRSILDYDPEAGIFRWKITTGRAIKGAIAGCRHKDSTGKGLYYWVIKINRKGESAGRIAWLHYYGVNPRDGYEIDHINHDGTDNRICNLRELLPHENAKNRTRRSTNKSGETGVCWDSTHKKWLVQVYAAIDGNTRRVYTKRFNDKAQAIKSAKEQRQLYGFFESHGSEKVTQPLPPTP